MYPKSVVYFILVWRLITTWIFEWEWKLAIASWIIQFVNRNQGNHVSKENWLGPLQDERIWKYFPTWVIFGPVGRAK
jgi:hypothetical protein